MEHAWIQNLTKAAPAAATPDSPDRSERYIAVVDPYWQSLKADIEAAVNTFNRRPGTIRPLLFEDAGAKLMLRGDGHGLDIRLDIEREHVRTFYTQLPWRQGRRPQVTTLRLDMRQECLVMLDCRGCIVDEPMRFILEPFFRAVTAPPRVKRTSAPRW